MVNPDLFRLQKMSVQKLDPETGTFGFAGNKVPYPTPWGPAQDCQTYRRGLHAVTTAGHGGFLIAKKFAEKNLTQAALDEAILFNNYYCFEEDCLASIAALELPELRRTGTDTFVSEEDLLATINQWNREYLVKRGLVSEGDSHVSQATV